MHRDTGSGCSGRNVRATGDGILRGSGGRPPRSDGLTCCFVIFRVFRGENEFFGVLSSVFWKEATS